MTAKMKKFYTEVSTEKTAGGYEIRLDGRTVKTPDGGALLCPTEALAEAVAGEWRAQDTHILPDAMPLTKLLNTALDRVATDRAAMREHVLRYAGTDLVCYLAEDSERELLEKQRETWPPLLAWLRNTHGISLEHTSGILPVEQPEDSVAALGALIDGMDDVAFTALQACVAATGSLVISIALVESRIDGDSAYEAAFLDELHQAETWGADEEAENRRKNIRKELHNISEFFRLARSAN